MSLVCISLQLEFMSLSRNSMCALHRTWSLVLCKALACFNLCSLGLLEDYVP